MAGTKEGGAKGKPEPKGAPEETGKSMVEKAVEGLEGISEQELIARIKEFLRKGYYKRLLKASGRKEALVVKYKDLDRFSPELGDMLRVEPDRFLGVASKAIETIDLPNPVRMRVSDFSDMTNIRDLRARHLGKFICVEGIVRRASEIRPEILETVWECPECGERIVQLRKGSFVSRPFECDNCGNRKGFKQIEKNMIDARWITLEEPFELVDGERPSQVNLVLTEDLTSPEHRRMTEPGSRLKATGILREIPKGKSYGVKLDFFMEVNHIEPTEVGWERLVVTKKDEDEIKKLAKDPRIYEKLVASLAPSLYGLNEVKESIILQLFGGVPRTLEDKTTFRGEIHLLLIGDPACLIGDERVFLGNGTVTKIKNLGTRHMQNIRVPVRIKGHISDMATTFHIYNNQPIIEIITESGKSLKGSCNQPVLVVEGRKRKWKRLDELKPGERVAVVPGVQCRKKSLIPTGWKKMDRRFGPIFHGRIPGNWDSRLGALTGYLLGDGYVREKKGEIVAIVNKDEHDLIEILARYIKDLFGLEPVIEARKFPGHEYKGRTIKSKNELYHIILRSMDLAENLKFLKEKRVPEPIFLSPNSVVKEFLKWLFQADGCVFSKGRGKGAIQLKQKEIELLRDVQTLLLRFGIHSRIYGNNLTIRRGNDIIRFAMLIGFASCNKIDKLNELSAEAINFKRARRQRSEKIVSIERLKGTQTVYDIEVPKSKRFIANGIVVHNSGKSQLMKLVPQIVPRSKYVSGKGTTTAGLTASVIKDEQFMGGWVLEAGAMVLANKGLLSVDEFEKMTQEDQVAMHEALESGTVSIAKASIVATLPAKTSVLAGGNPKFSRFDPYQSISKQINIPDTLLSRFDLKFMLKDVPNAEQDRKLVDHILRTREGGYEPSIPKINPDFIKKYVAYAKVNYQPRLTKETGRILRNFYLRTRKRAESGAAPIPITLRQFEALMRLSEASAKIQLSPEVRPEDAKRAMKLMRYSLEQLGMTETGEIDVDKSEGLISSSERGKIRMVLDIISELSKTKKQIPRGAIEEEAKKKGIEKDELEEILDKLTTDGFLFQPSPGYLERV